MLVECNKCKKEILTECDIYVVIPTENYAINCGCEFLGKSEQLEKELDKISNKLTIIKTILVTHKQHREYEK